MNAALQLTQRTDALGASAVGLGAAVWMLMQGGMQMTDRFNSLEALMRRPIALGLIGVMASMMMGAGAVNLPMRLRSLLSRPEVRFLVIALVGFAGSGDIETAVIGTLFIGVVMQLLRTPAERKETPFMI